MNEEETNKSYLGDGVYASQSPLGLVLTTENGIKVMNRIVIEYETLNALCEYLNLQRKPYPKVRLV